MSQRCLLGIKLHCVIAGWLSCITSFHFNGHENFWFCTTSLYTVALCWKGRYLSLRLADFLAALLSRFSVDLLEDLLRFMKAQSLQQQKFVWVLRISRNGYKRLSMSRCVCLHRIIPLISLCVVLGAAPEWSFTGCYLMWPTLPLQFCIWYICQLPFISFRRHSI